MALYTADDWYWIDGKGAVFDSARNGLVSSPASDSAYQAFLASGSKATPLPSDDFAGGAPTTLDEVLTAANLPVSGLATPTKGQLLAYANAKQWALATGGYTITVNSTPLVFPTDAVSMGLITGKAARLAQPNPPASFKWQTPTGFVTITAADFILVATQVADFVQTTFDDLDPVFAAIEAESITTFAAVDSAAWPSNVSTTPA